MPSAPNVQQCVTKGERFGIVSLGTIGRRHLANLRSLRPNASIAVCRLSDHPVGTDIPDQCDVVLHGVEELVQFAPQAAIIASPASTHGAVAAVLARAGIHLLIEKPLTTRAKEARELGEVVKSAGVVAMVGYNLRMMPSLRAVKNAIDVGELGRIYSVRAEVGQYLPAWRPGRDYRDTVSAKAELGGGALLELSHELDYLVWIFGMPDRISAHGGNCGDLEINVEDLVEMVMEYDDPAKLISVHLDFLDQAGCRQLRIIGKSGTICWNALEDTASRFESGSCRWLPLASEPLDQRNDMYVLELQQFLRCIEVGCTPEADIVHGCNVLRLIDATRQAIISGRSVEIKLNG